MAVPNAMTLESNAMPIQIQQRMVDGCIVLDIQANQFTYPYSTVIKSEIQQLLQEGHRHFILNFERVQMVDSFGLATILSALKMTKELQGNLALCGLNETVVRLVKVTHLSNVLETWPSETKAAYYLTHS